MTSFLPYRILRAKYSNLSWCLERPIRYFMDFYLIFFSGVRYMESHGFFYCNTSFKTFPIFIAYSCSWRDCALGEILIYLGVIIMPNYFMFWCKLFLFQVQKTLRSKYWNISCKNVNQWRNSAISPLSCCETRNFDGFVDK